MYLLLNWSVMIYLIFFELLNKYITKYMIPNTFTKYIIPIFPN